MNATISSKVPVLSLGLKQAYVEQLHGAQIYYVVKLQGLTQNELLKKTTPRCTNAVIKAMGNIGLTLKDGPLSQKVPIKPRTVTFPIGGDTEIGKVMKAVMNAAGLNAFGRLTKAKQEILAQTMKDALEIMRSQTQAARPNHEQGLSVPAFRAPKFPGD
jgi:hypothetical protein